MKILRLATFFLILVYGLKFTLSFQKSPTLDLSETDTQVTAVKKKFRSTEKKRAPAAVEAFKAQPTSNPTYTAAQKNDSLFRGFEAGEDGSAADPKEAESSMGGSYIASETTPRRLNYEPLQSSQSRSGSKPAATAGKAVLFTGPQAFRPAATAGAPSPSTPAPTSSGAAPSSNSLNCSASIGAGTYSNPLNVALTCSTAATIRYCLAEGSCCDPTTGSTYASAIGVGAEAKTYCLSYLGEDSTGQSTTIYEHFYTFNPSTPNIQVSADRIVYQTTQLDGKSSFTSSDFGTANLAAGVLNLKNNDPGPASCDDMITNATSPYVVMPLTSVSSLNPSQQVDVTLPKSTMDYGDNYLVSYLSHTLFAGVYGCSVKKITLEDFPYFEETPANGVLNGSVLEFSGGFVATGYFETPMNVYRGPASGSSTENISGQELRTGLMSIFH